MAIADADELLERYERETAAYAAWEEARRALVEYQEMELAALRAQRPQHPEVYERIGRTFNLSPDRIKQIAGQFRLHGNADRVMGRPDEPKNPHRDAQIWAAFQQAEKAMERIDAAIAKLEAKHERDLAKHDAKAPPNTSYASLAAEYGVARQRIGQIIGRARRRRDRGAVAVGR